MLINGCAGSGKTLLVAEKAIRLDDAGIRPLVLCHNPNLARHIRGLVQTHAIDVFDISSFVHHLLGEDKQTQAEWSVFHEPLEIEIQSASSIAIAKRLDYDAVLVDEGQDFRDTWWKLVESVLTFSRTKTLYIFCDDNQALLPFRSTYPAGLHVESMSRNCRNAGNIFEIVRRFHRDAPIVSSFLKRAGVAKITVFDEEEIRQRLEDALLDAYHHVRGNQFVVLTNEPSAEYSKINRFEFPNREYGRWRTVVERDLGALAAKALKKVRNLRGSHSQIANRFGVPIETDFSEYFSVPHLSQQLVPTESDVAAVCKFARRMRPFFAGSVNGGGHFSVSSRGLRVSTRTHTGKLVAPNDTSKVYYYASPTWARYFAAGSVSTLLASSRDNSSDTISLYTVDAYKGLECDALVLFVNRITPSLLSEMYVGCSRAVGYLHVVINRKAYARLSTLDDLEIARLQAGA
ncbi:MAG: hypothetical protein H6816_15865 [Phycisphaerales bacterium]|nr:hypothetical protein [Phycisphaerales bacterium]